MRARLFSKVGETKGVDFELGSGASIGRHPDNEIVLAPSMVSSHHARITRDPEGGCYLLEDLGSLNGTALDGRRISGRERLGHLHVITVAGEHDFIFQDLERCAGRHGAAPAAAAGEDRRPEEKTSIEEAPVALPGFLAGSGAPETGAPPEPSPEAAGAGEKTSIERAPVALPGVFAAGNVGEPPAAGRAAGGRLPDTEELEGPPAAPPSEPPPEAEPIPEEVLELMAGGGGRATFHLELVGPEGEVERVELSDGENLVGRSSVAQVQPDSLDISRRHAVLTVAGGKVTVRDLGSRNRTFLAGEEIDGEVEVGPGMQLRFGGVEARLVVTGD
jgi:pSer/pThr/pTyr-binding forkhead associated (FHA) protein